MSDTERANNALLKALLPGGILHHYTDRSPAEVLCVPQQAFLEATGLAPYLLLSSTDIGAGWRTGDSSKPTVTLTEDQYHRIADILQNQLLYYHLVHFDSIASTTFTTLRGHRGSFANTLDSVSRFGRIGTSRVVCNMDPLIEPVDSEDDTPTDGHACGMHIYIIEKPLMDEDEIHNALLALERVFVSPREGSSLFPQGQELQEQQQQLQPQCEGKSTESASLSRESTSKYRQAVAADNEVGFAEFQQYMKMPVCAPLVQAISIFVCKAQQNETLLTDNRDVARVIQHCLNQCNRISFFSNDVQKMRIAAEGFEKYIMTKLYWQAFGANPEEQQRGAELHDKLQVFNEFVTADQLDALQDVESHELWKPAMMDLEAMNLFKSPRDKLRCAVRSCMKLAEAVESVLSSRGKSEKSTDGMDSASTTHRTVFGADEFIPCFILLVLRAMPRNYYINVCYIVNFRDARLLSHEEEYCLTNLESSAEFWLKYSPDIPLADQTQTSSLMSSSNTRVPIPVPVSLEELFSLPPVTVTVTEPGRGANLTADAVKEKGGEGLQQEPQARSENSITSLEWNASASPPTNFSFMPLTENVRRDDVARLLLEENKAFEDLTVGELRAIVEEARTLFQAKRM